MQMPMLFVTVVMACLAGCANSSSGLVRKDRNESDSQKVVAINAWALRRGASVTWVNPPVKRVALETGARND